MKQLTLCFLLLSAFQVFAQKTFPLTGKVVDAKTGQLLPRATIRDTSHLVQYYTNDSGVFTMKLIFPTELTVSYVGYKTEVVRIAKETADTLLIKLKPVEEALKEVDVLPELPKYLFFGSRQTQVLDYEFWGDKTLIAVYNYFQKRCYLVLLDRYNNIVDEQPIPSDFESFYKSGIDKYYAVTANRIFELYPQTSRIGIKPESKEFFYSKVVYYKGWHDQYFYICEISKNKQAAVFYIEDTKFTSGKFHPFTVVGDQEKYMKASKMKRGIDSGRAYEMGKVFTNYNMVAEGDFLEDFDAFETRNLFIKQGMYTRAYLDHPVFTPLFTNDSNLLIFDFYEDRLIKYAFDATPKDTVAISFHKKEGWMPWLYKTDDRYFTGYTNNAKCSIASLDSEHWETGKTFTLYYPNTVNMKVRGKYVYYLHQPTYGDNHVFLFREKWTE